MGDKIIGVPTVKGIGGAFKDFGVGALGGLLFLLAYQLFGAFGLLAAPLLAGSMLKGDRSTIISTMAGFALFALGALGTGGGPSGNDEVM